MNRADLNSNGKEDNSEWKKIKKPINFDNNLNTKLRGITEEKAKDRKNHNLEIWTDPAIIDACKKENVTVCRECGGVNCYLWMKKAKRETIPPSFLGKCKGQISKFGDLSRFAQQYTYYWVLIATDLPQIPVPRGKHIRNVF